MVAESSRIYSLIGTVQLNGVEPDAYLKEVLARIASHPINRVDELLKTFNKPSNSHLLIARLS